MSTLEIRPELKIQLDHFAVASHHSEGDLANDAVALYLAQQCRIIGRIREGLAQAQRGEFVTDEEMGAFFTSHSEPAWIAECEQRAAAIDRGEMALIAADEVMLKYRQ